MLYVAFNYNFKQSCKTHDTYCICGKIRGNAYAGGLPLSGVT